MATILQLTDFHLYADAAGKIKGVATRDSFQAVFHAACKHYPQAQTMLLGGDLAQDEALVTYQWLADFLRQHPFRYMVTPGNHCKLERLYEGLESQVCVHAGRMRSMVEGEWHIIGLNTHVRGRVGGALSADELAWLDQQLALGGYALIAMHHHPFAIGSRWLDEIALRNADDFWRVVRRHDHVKGIVAGHVHQQLDIEVHGIHCMATPSTCIQFRPNMPTFALDTQSPGYRWIDLADDGQLTTGVERVEGFIPPDLNDTSEY